MPKIEEIFHGLQRQLEVELEVGRSAGVTPGAVGDASESSWIGLLRKHLPNRYQVGKGVVLDSRGAQSEEIDVIVYDHQYTPLLHLEREGRVVVPAESVYAVFEVKQTLSKRHLEYAGGKVASVRRLYRTSAEINYLGGKIEKPRKPFRILGGILSLDAEWQGDVEPRLREVLGARPVAEQIDLGCAVKRCAFTVDYGGAGLELDLAGPKLVLLHFLLRLVARFQHLATVPAIDYPEYLRLIEARG